MGCNRASFLELHILDGCGQLLQRKCHVMGKLCSFGMSRHCPSQTCLDWCMTQTQKQPHAVKMCAADSAYWHHWSGPAHDRFDVDGPPQCLPCTFDASSEYQSLMLDLSDQQRGIHTTFGLADPLGAFTQCRGQACILSGLKIRSCAHALLTGAAAYAAAWGGSTLWSDHQDACVRNAFGVRFDC